MLSFRRSLKLKYKSIGVKEWMKKYNSYTPILLNFSRLFPLKVM